MLYLFLAFFIDWIVTLVVSGGFELFGIADQYRVEITSISAVITSLILLCFYFKDKGKEVWLKQKKGGIKEGILVAILAFATGVGLNIFLLSSELVDSSMSYQVTAEQMYQSSKWIQVLGLGILIPIKEELIYRVMLYRRLRERLSVIISMLISAAFFGIYHGNIVQLIYAFAMALFLAYVYEVFRGMWAPILFHIVANLASICMTALNGYGIILGNPIIAVIFLICFAAISSGIVYNLRKLRMES